MKRFIALAIGIFAALALIFIGAASMGWTDGARYAESIERIRSSGGAAVAGALIAGLLAADLLLPVPSSVLMTLSGALLGTWRGAAVSLAGALGSAVIGFGLCRRFGRGAFERAVGGGETARVESFFERYGVWAILLSRSVPMLTEAVSCLAGLSRMHWVPFLALSLAGTAPICLVYAWAGRRAGSVAGQGWAVLVAFAFPALGFALVRRFTHAPGRAAPPAERPPG
jgi:uncharacterized membrane protein YdjX (TVP38/TMEM64 family)